MLSLLTLLLTANATEPLWPDLSEPPRVGGGSKDAAVIVAIEDYNSVGDIPGAKANGLDWYSYLTDGRGIAASRVQLLTDSDATKEGIETAVAEATRAVKSGGTLWFVFIGHGAPSRDGEDGLLVGWDTQQTAASVYARGLQQGELIDLLEQRSPGETVAVLDACFSGQGNDSTALVAGLQMMVPEYASSTGSSVTILSAGTSQQFAGPLPGAGRPAFSYLALGALLGWGDANGDSTVTTGEVHEYTLGALRALPLGRSQTPGLSGDGGMALSSAKQAGPSLSAIRRALEGPVVVPDGGSGDFAAQMAELQRQQEAAQEAERLAVTLRANVEAEVARQTSAIQREASGAWSSVSSLAEVGDESGKKALELFIEAYSDREVVIGDESRAVSIPEIAEAEAWLARYGSQSSGPTWSGSSGYEMVRIDPGTFTMGSPSSESGRDEDEVQHEVRLSTGFLMGATEVSQGLWLSVMGSNPASGKDYQGVTLEGSEYPVVYVRWCDAVVFANKLSERDGLEKAYTLPAGFSATMSDDRCKEQSGSVRWNRDANGYRLPTEAEWEFAARAGGRDLYAGTSSQSEMCGYGNVNNPSVKSKFDWNHDAFPCEDGHTTLAPVGSFRANPWGLHDMSGNVWEWCWDWYGDYATNANVDPYGASTGSSRVNRGGSWVNIPATVRVANRSRGAPSGSSRNLGLRLVRSL